MSVRSGLARLPAGLMCLGICFAVPLEPSSNAYQDRNPDHGEDGRVQLKTELGTPFYLDGMEVILRGSLTNGSDGAIRMVPAEKCYSNGAWQVLLNVPMVPPPEPLGPIPSDYSVEIPAGQVHTFELRLGRHGAREKRVLQASVALEYMQGGELRSVSGQCGFRVVPRTDLQVLKGKDRIVETGHDHPWMPDKAYRVRVQKVRHGGKVYLVSFAFAGPEEGREPASANIIDEVSEDSDFVLGATQDTDVVALLAYEKNETVRVLRLSAHSGAPVKSSGESDEPPK